MMNIYLSQPNKKLDELEARSLSSQQSKRILPDLKTEIIKNIKKQHSVNKRTYHQIIQDKPHFNHSLYQINTQQSLDHLSLQFDYLIEENEKLEKELAKIAIQKEQNQGIKKRDENQNTDHYTFLRAVWKKKIEHYNAEETVNSLTHIVGSIKGHIKNLCKIQSKNSQSIQQLIKSSKQFRQLQKKMKQIEQKSKSNKTALQNKIMELQSKQNKLLLQNASIGQKLRACQQQKKQKDIELLNLGKKLKTLELEVLQKNRQDKNKIERTNSGSQLNTNYNILNLQNVPKQWIFNNSEFTITLKSKYLEDNQTIQIDKNLKQVKTFLSTSIKKNGKKNSLDYLSFQECTNLSQIQTQYFSVFKESKDIRKSTLDKMNIRSDVSLTSQQKKRRFERTRNLK